ncbi:MAG TPA: acetyl-CoA carboxylase carboxyl transferase subunit alpha, partial [Bacteroidia bacterium]
MNYLDFEKPIAELQEQIEKLKQAALKSKIDVSKTVADIELKIKGKRAEIFSNLTPWQRVQISRHPDRPYTLDYI